MRQGSAVAARLSGSCFGSYFSLAYGCCNRFEQRLLRSSWREDYYLREGREQLAFLPLTDDNEWQGRVDALEVTSDLLS